MWTWRHIIGWKGLSWFPSLWLSLDFLYVCVFAELWIMVVFSGLLIFNFLLYPFYFLYKWYKCLWDYLMSLILSFCSKDLQILSVFYDVLVVLGLLISFCASFCSSVSCLSSVSVKFMSLSLGLSVCYFLFYFDVLLWLVFWVFVLLPLSHPLWLVSAVLTCFLSSHYLLCIIVSVSPCPLFRALA